MTQRYQNAYSTDIKKSMWDFFLWRLGRYKDLQSLKKMPLDFTFPAQPESFKFGDTSVTWMGHSTFLIELFGFHILTDPVWSDYCSPIPIRSLKRCHRPPLKIEELPPIDLVLISHNHYDHLDLKTVRQLHSLYPTIEWVLPLGLTPWFRKRGIYATKELARWEKMIWKGITITGVPAQHFSGRSLWDTNKTLWNGYVVEMKNKRFYFTGDTGYNPFDFKQIGRTWPFMDLSLIPIGTYLPKKFMSPVHCSPAEAVEIHKDVHSKFSLGMHWKTFHLSDEPLDRPPYDLYLALQKQNIPYQSFLPVNPGVRVNW